jgi:carbamoyl-phosphate synthase large subunit
MDRPVRKVEGSVFELDYVGVKAPQFSFTRLEGADPILGVEMASTGEVACIGRDFNDAFLKALLAVGLRLPIRAVLLSTGPVAYKAAFLDSAQVMAGAGIRMYGTHGTAAFMADSGVDVTPVDWPLDGGTPNALDLIRRGEVDLVVNIPKDATEQELANDYMIRRAAVDHGVPLITNIQLAQRLAQALTRKSLESLEIQAWDEY